MQSAMDDELERRDSFLETKGRGRGCKCPASTKIMFVKVLVLSGCVT